MHLTLLIQCLRSSRFVVLEAFWTILQKVFLHSDNTKVRRLWFHFIQMHSQINISQYFYLYCRLNGNMWYLPDGKGFLTPAGIPSTMCWKTLPRNFPSLLKVMARVSLKGYSPGNNNKMIGTLLDKDQLKIELSTYVEGLADLRKLCYFSEGGGTDMPLKVAERIDAFLDSYSSGCLKKFLRQKHLLQWLLTGPCTKKFFSVREQNWNFSF